MRVESACIFHDDTAHNILSLFAPTLFLSLLCYTSKAKTFTSSVCLRYSLDSEVFDSRSLEIFVSEQNLRLIKRCDNFICRNIVQRD